MCISGASDVEAETGMRYAVILYDVIALRI